MAPCGSALLSELIDGQSPEDFYHKKQFQNNPTEISNVGVDFMQR